MSIFLSKSGHPDSSIGSIFGFWLTKYLWHAGLIPAIAAINASKKLIGEHLYDTGYPHSSRADKNSYSHDGRADKNSYPHNMQNQYIMLSL